MGTRHPEADHAFHIENHGQEPPRRNPRRLGLRAHRRHRRAREHSGQRLRLPPLAAQPHDGRAAAHIIESGLLASGELTRKDGNFQRRSYPEFIEEYGGDRAKTRKKGELIKMLRTTFDEGVAAFRRRGEKEMMKPIVQFNGEPASRLTWLNHAIAHEEYHRGQLALYARLLGRVPALTKLIEGG